MAVSMREVKLRINATKKTAQITKAMNMISAAKLKTAEKQIRSFYPFMQKIRTIMANVMHDKNALADVDNILLKKRDIKTTCFIVIASDKGLAGSFNVNVQKALTKAISELPKEMNYSVCPLGLKAYYFVKRKGYKLFSDKPYTIRDDVAFEELMPLIKKILIDFMMGEFDQVTVIYNHYINTLKQEITETVVLPVTEIEVPAPNQLYEYDGDMEQLLNTILPIYVENLLYGLVLDSKACEHACRMNAMQKATDNASEIVDKLQLLYNRARQSAITLELTDIIGGASVINKN